MGKQIQKKKLWLRRVMLIGIDGIIIGISSFLALAVRFEFKIGLIEPIFLKNIMKCMVMQILLTLVVFFLFRIYNSLWEYAGVQEAIYIAFASVSATFIEMIIMVAAGTYLPRSYYFLYPMILFTFIGTTRLLYRIFRRQKTLLKKVVDRKNRHEKIKKVMIIGAGEAGNLLIKEIQNSQQLNAKVCCVLDVDPRKQGKFLRGVKIEGNRNDILHCVEKYKIDEIIIALPRLSVKELQPILEICRQTKCLVKKLPGVYQLVNGEVSVSRLKEIGIEDLLGREPVRVDLKEILNYVKDQVVMVTGGAGSIGSELCRQIATHQPKQIIIVELNENASYILQRELLQKYPELNIIVLIGSIRDEERLESIFKKYQPNIIYHAAAHKHVPLMEVSPNEAIKNNVLGTYNVVKMADKFKTQKFIQISTDKAVNPTNIMGASKRICEMIIQSYNKYSNTEYVAVRFGNVLGSNGSVVPLFKKQIQEGGPITVTDPKIVRYFMTIPEAASLVLQAGAYARGGEIFVLDMGEPVKILDLAKNMIHLSGLREGKDIEIVFTGLRPGEKLYEELLMEEEGIQTTPNKLIYIGKPIEFDEKQLYQMLDYMQRHKNDENVNMRESVKQIVPTYVIG